MNEAAAMLELAERLSEAERTIQALLSGQIDAVVDPATSNPVLLFKAQHELRKSEERYRRERDRARSYLDVAEVILLALDSTASITLINRYGAELLGWSVDELIGKPWIDTCIPPRLRKDIRSFFGTVIGGKTGIHNNEVILRSGEERLIEWRHRLLTDEGGNVTGVFTCGTDITEEKRAHESLRLAEERMRFALDAGGLGIWDMDYHTGQLEWSESLAEQYGIEKGKFEGTIESFMEAVHPDDREELAAIIAEATRTGSDFKAVHRTLGSDGTVRWVSGAGKIQLGADGKPTRGVGVSQDITEQTLLAAKFQQGQKMEAIGRLASGVAHDFNNLLTVILGFADLMSSEVPASSQHGKDLGEIMKAAQRATGLTRQLLAFSRQQVLHVAPIDMNALIADMSGMFKRLIGEDIKVTMRLTPNICPAIGDRSQMEQVIMNLVVNARDAMANGGELTIETSEETLADSAFHEQSITRGQYVLIAVTDNGTGMSKETQHRLFEPFFTTKELGKGTGLGLSTTYGIVKQSKGYIWVYSELGKGTTFKVYIPCFEGEDGAACPLDVAEPLLKASETVLLVEDEPVVRLLTKRILSNAGYDVIDATTGAEAEAIYSARGGRIDIVLTDVVMPGLSGPDTVERLREQSPDLKVLYMSGYTEQSAAHRAGIGADAAFIQKPFTAGDLTRRIRETLDS